MNIIETYVKQDDYHEAIKKSETKKVFYRRLALNVKDDIFSASIICSAIVIEDLGTTRLMTFKKTLASAYTINSKEAEVAFLKLLQDGIEAIVIDFQKANGSVSLFEGEVGVG